MNTVRLRPLCHALGFNATRPEQWISRGYFNPSEPGVPGRARELTKRDAVQLLALVELVDAGFDASHIYREVQNLILRKDTQVFLVISTGYLGRLIPATPRGGPGVGIEDCAPIYFPGQLYSDIVRVEELQATITQKERHVSIVLSLDNLHDRVNEAWNEIYLKASGQPGEERE